MIEVQVDMVLVRPDAAAFADFERHRTRDDVARREILRRRGIAFHETLALGVGEVTTLAARALGDQHARAIDAGRMELDEFHVLQGQAGAQHHAAAVAGAGVRRGGGEIGAAIAARRAPDSLAAATVAAARLERHADAAEATTLFLSIAKSRPQRSR